VATLLVFFCGQLSAAADDFGPSPSSAAAAAGRCTPLLGAELLVDLRSFVLFLRAQSDRHFRVLPFAQACWPCRDHARAAFRSSGSSWKSRDTWQSCRGRQTGNVDMSPTSVAATDVGLVSIVPPLASALPSLTKVESEEPIVV